MRARDGRARLPLERARARGRVLSGPLPALLIASPQLRDPFFEHTVVLLWHYDAEGAIGVVLNRPLPHTLDEVLELEPGVQPADGCRVAWGGPVEAGSGTVVAPEGVDEDDGWLLPDGAGVTRSQEALLRLLRRRVPLTLCLGYAGWGPGQLDQEIASGSWLFTEPTRALLFDTPAEQCWEQALATLGLSPGQVWSGPAEA